jgi:hypothetical protein
MYYIGPIIAVLINRNINTIQNYFNKPVPFYYQTKYINKPVAYPKKFDFKLINSYNKNKK